MSWQDVAARVHQTVGGEPLFLHRAAANIQADRQRMAALFREAGHRSRIVAGLLTALPVVALLVRQVVDPGFITRAASTPTGWMVLAAAVVLMGLGGWWSWSLSKPPFAAFPWRRRSHQDRLRRWQEIADAIDRSWLRVIAGEDFASALKRELPEERRYGRKLRQALSVESRDGTTPDMVAATRTRMYADWRQTAQEITHRSTYAFFAPFAVCIVPAVLLIGLVRL